VGPAEDLPAGVTLGAIGQGGGPIGLQASFELGASRKEGHGRVITVTHRHHSARPAHPFHLDQCRHRVPDVLEDLVGMHDVEGPVLVVEVEEVTHLKGQSRGPLFDGRPARFFDHLDRSVESHHPARRQKSGQVAGDRPRSAPHVEQGHPRSQVGKQVAGRVFGGAPAMRPQHAVVMAVGIGDVVPVLVLFFVGDGVHSSSVGRLRPIRKEVSVTAYIS